ncbi:MAG TPA: 30S ribosome-binding factor RbfA, partial [Blastocatellia bacterium]|nr:30S ribosome-binding factor RbfA [Blastocatellia bacterium]
RTAKVYVSVLGTEDEVRESMAALKHAAGFIRNQLGIVLRMKRTPDLHFVYDDTDLRAARIEELLNQEVAKAQKPNEFADETAVETDI